MTQVTPLPPTEGSPVAVPLKSHHGVLVLIFGILGLALWCVCIGLAFGIVAWVLGRHDLKQIDAGAMDPSGRGLAKAGMICGIVSVVIWVLWIIAYICFYGAIMAMAVKNAHMTQ